MGSYELNNMILEICVARAARHPHELRMVCCGGCQGPTWMWLERGWTKPNPQQPPRVKWCQQCEGAKEGKVSWRVSVPKEVLMQFNKEEQMRWLHDPVGPAPWKPQQLALEDRPTAPRRDMSPGRGPWGAAASKAASSAASSSAAPRTPVTSPPMPWPPGLSMQQMHGWTRVESTTTPGLLYYRHQDGRTQFEDPMRSRAPALPGPPAAAPVVAGSVVMAHSSTVMQGSATPQEWEEFHRWRNTHNFANYS